MTLNQIARECTTLSNKLERLSKRFMGPVECELADQYLRRLAELDALAALIRATGAGRERASA